MCVCRHGFYGAACDQCWYGLTATADGKNCSALSTPRIRRDFLSLNSSQQQNYIDVLLLMKKAPSNFYIVGSNASSILSVYDYLAAVHFIAVEATSTDLAHHGPGFPTWHRAFLLLFERLAQNVSGDPTFTLPYVNEFNATAINHTVYLLGEDGMNNSDCHSMSGNCSCYLNTEGPGAVFSSWRNIGPNGTFGNNISRALGCDKSSATPAGAPAYIHAIGTKNYSGPPWNKSYSLMTLSNLLEGYACRPEGIRTESAMENCSRDTHNRLHVYMGGTMRDVKTAASDPFFWLHHAFIDQILERWMAKHPDSVRPWAIADAPDGHWYKDCQAPFVPLLPHAIFFSTSNNYGYKYDELLGSTDSAPTSVDSLAVKALVTTAILILILIIYYAITAIPRLRHYNYENI